MPSVSPPVNDSHALVLSLDALMAALVGALLETHRYHPVFADTGEPPRDALRRLRPGVVLVDCEHNDACTETFFGPAIMTGARIVVFSTSQSREEVTSFAARFGFDSFVLPADLAIISSVMRAAPR